MAISPDGRWIAVLNRFDVLLIDADAGTVVHCVGYATRKAGASYTGIVFSDDGKHLYASNIRGTIEVFTLDDQGKPAPAGPIRIGANRPQSRSNALPAGLALSGEGAQLFVALNMNNTLGQIDLAEARLVREIEVGSAPYDVVLVGQKAYVSNWGGRRPRAAELTGPAGRGTPVKVDPTRHIASEGSVSVVDLLRGKVVKEIVVGLHPSGLAVSPDGKLVCVANANSDTVSVIETRTDSVVETISTRPARKLLFGSAPNALAFSPQGGRLYVSNGTNNAVAIIALRPPNSRLLGLIPTGWYPAGLVLDAERNALYVANVKGIGSRDRSWQGRRKLRGKTVFGYNSHDYRGSVSLIPIPGGERLAEYTRTVIANNRMTEAISALAPPRRGVRLRPVPARHGEPSVFNHVIYIIKENRTYDQVFGDMPQGEGDPSLCLFGREVTPNHHKLAEEFVLFDNFYCSGTLSADGHQWTDEAYVTDYVEKAYGGWPRSYPFDGGDALAYASSGFIWDNVLAHGKTLRVYGEFVAGSVRWKDSSRKDRPGFLDCYRDFLDGGGLIEIRATAKIKTLAPYLCESVIGFPSIVPDVYRAAEFIKELKRCEASGQMPNFCIMLLPNDHTAGTRPGMPTPEAAVADNDLALGRIVEAVSRSRFWKDTCIFVVEDDPQNGFDHIDGHRTVALVVSPYTRRGYVDSTNYNQTSMMRTIELILGLPPMNQFDSTATPMHTCFADKPDLRPYEASRNRIPLGRLNPKLSEIRDPRQRYWAVRSIEQPLDEIDQADEDTLNRVLWHAVKGPDAPYPEWAVLGLPDRQG